MHRRQVLKLIGIGTVYLSASCAPLLHSTRSDEKPYRGLHPTEVDDLISFWDFQEPAGSDRISSGPYSYPLKERNGAVKRVSPGIFGPHSAYIEWGQWFSISREDCPALNIHGPDAQVSVIAWIQRIADNHWQFIAGMWNEQDAVRQYALFTSGHRQSNYRTYDRIEAEHQPHGYISAVGGATPGKPFCYSYATGPTYLQKHRWYMLTSTYDGSRIKVYVNGSLDENPGYNPFLYEKGIFDAGINGADFTVAQRAVPKWPDYPQNAPDNGVGFSGYLGGLGIFDRALTPAEIYELYQFTRPAMLDSSLSL